MYVFCIVNKDVTNNDGVYRLLKEVETQFADCLIPPSSISKNKIIGKGAYTVHLPMHIITRTLIVLTVMESKLILTFASF